MADFLKFEFEGGSILVEVEGADIAGSETGETDAGLSQWARSKAGGVVAVARTGFSEAIRSAVSMNVPAFINAADALPRPPAEMEITFGLNASVEAGNIAVGKVAGECNYQVRMLWRHPEQ